MYNSYTICIICIYTIFDQVKTNYLGVSEHESFMSHAPKNPTCWGCPVLSFTEALNLTETMDASTCNR